MIRLALFVCLTSTTMLSLALVGIAPEPAVAPVEVPAAVRPAVVVASGPANSDTVAANSERQAENAHPLPVRPPVAPADTVRAALEDARRLPPGESLVTRYLSLASTPVEYRREVRQAVAFWSNSLSVEAEIIPPRQVSADLIAVRLIDYGWSAKTWDKFADVDPYFSVRLVKQWPGGVWQVRDGGDGRSYPAGGPYTVTASARWLQAAEMAELFQRTGSRAPVLRADWWTAQVAVPPFYYQMLGLGKKRADFEALVGLDRKAAQRVRKEAAGIVQDSTVALHARTIHRFASVTGAYYETRDAKENVGERNPLRLLDTDRKHDAEEVVATLPNGMFAFGLFSAAGERQDAAPDDIASDGLSTSPDRRVKPGLSCVRCHQGLRPVDCWFRKTYSLPDQLAVLDPARAIRFRQLYQSDFDRLLRRDEADYAESLRQACGLLPGDAAKVIAGTWQRYVEQPVTLEDAARECGVTAEQLRAAIRRQAAPDPVAFSLGKGQAVRREHADEIFPVLMGYLQGGG